MIVLNVSKEKEKKTLPISFVPKKGRAREKEKEGRKEEEARQKYAGA